MAIGNSVSYNVPTAGSAVGTFDRATNTLFLRDETVGTTDIPVRLQFTTSDVSSQRRRITMSMKFNPSTIDVPAAATNGRISISFGVDVNLGEAVTDADVLTHVKHFASVLIDGDVLPALLNGSAM